MDVKRYLRARELFDEICDLPAAEQRDAARVACDGDASLYEILTDLLSIDASESPLDALDPQRLAQEAPQEHVRPQRLEPGLEVGNYVVERMLGEGGTAQVWAVRHTVLGTMHALKVLLWASPVMQRRLIREAQAQAQLAHPHIVPVSDVIDINGLPGLLMPLIAGPALDDLLQEYTPSQDEAVALLRAIASGIRYAHDHGLVHRDLKPGNVLLDVQADGLVPRVADFGLVKGNNLHTQTRAGTVMGTPLYAAPEQLQDSAAVDQRADMWALGVIFYELLTGRRPFSGQDLAAILASHHTPPDYSAVPPDLVGTIQHLLHLDPAQRLPDCATLLQQLPPTPPLLLSTPISQHAVALCLPGTIPPTARRADAAPPLDTHETLLPPQPPAPRRQTPLLWLGLAALTLALAALGLPLLRPAPLHKPELTPPPPDTPAATLAPDPVLLPEPAPAPAPEPVPTPIPSTPEPAHTTPTPAPLPAPAPVEAAAAPEVVVREVPSASIRVTGDGAGSATLVSDAGARAARGAVPPGTYTLQVMLPTRGAFSMEVTVAAGQSLTIGCDDNFGMCSPDL